MTKYRIELFRIMKPEYGELVVNATSLKEAREKAEKIIETRDDLVKWSQSDEVDDMGIMDIIEE
jgi:hypothetical protein